ncbi:MAG: hypothetical protein RLO21_15875, partial [Nitratireductor sp.]
MALASLREDILERFIGATEVMPEPDHSVGFYCHICRLRLESEAMRLDHLAAEHRADSPALLLYGRVASDEERLREVLAPKQVSAVNCTEAFVEVNGSSRRPIDPAEIGVEITKRR